jgi:hypothetical protein
LSPSGRKHAKKVRAVGACEDCRQKKKKVDLGKQIFLMTANTNYKCLHVLDSDKKASQVAKSPLPADTPPEDPDPDTSDCLQETDGSDTPSEAVATPQSPPTPPTDGSQK